MNTCHHCCYFCLFINIYIICWLVYMFASILSWSLMFNQSKCIMLMKMFLKVIFIWIIHSIKLKLNPSTKVVCLFICILFFYLFTLYASILSWSLKLKQSTYIMWRKMFLDWVFLQIIFSINLRKNKSNQNFCSFFFNFVFQC